MLTVERLKEVIKYTPKTGEFRWIKKPSSHANRVIIGARAGTITTKGYLRIQIDGEHYLASRLAFLWMTGSFPEKLIDHKDVNPLNNRWSNLRQATNAQNVSNGHRRRNNTSGHKGVYYHVANDKYIAQISVNGCQMYLGSFPSPKRAYAKYCEAAKLYHGEFARLN